MVNEAALSNQVEHPESEHFLVAKQIRKVYYPTVAVNNLDISIKRGEILGLVGANGAGKSTLIKVLAGITNADQGSLIINGEQINLQDYDPQSARQKGIRVVHQELSLCKNLTVYENFYIEQNQRFPKAIGWRETARKLAKEALDRVFPGNTININAGLDTLSIAQQQMVEIARATSDLNLNLLILDEPTSSLPTEQAEQLQEYIKSSSKQGASYIYISHRLTEVMYLASRVYIMQNGVEKYQCAVDDTCEDDMIKRMGEGIGLDQNVLSGFTRSELNSKISVSCNDYSSKKLHNINLNIYGGEIIGLTGLEGNGQLELLQEIFLHARYKKDNIHINGKIAYVAGDRKKEGIFPLWSISDNLTISKIASKPLFNVLSPQVLVRTVEDWFSSLKIKSDNPEALITSLSGGNQQKVLIARALAVDADIILLDDPTRGVDVATKVQLYNVFREAAQNGKLVIWRTSDDAELTICTKLFVVKNGTIGGEFDSTDLNLENLLQVAFSQQIDTTKTLDNKKARTPSLFLFSAISVVLLYGICGMISPAIFSKFGLELLAVGFTPFIFAALSQTFIIGLGHIDLSVGAFMGLVNVICATVLDQNTFVGLATLVLVLFVYSLMGVVIYLRNIPSIIITLGMSFVWTGIALSLQEMPGGHTPDWMVGIFNMNNPVLQGVIIVLLIFIAIAVIIYRSRYGTVLRGFGNNDTAMLNSGWSKAKAYFSIYFIAGVFAMMGGISFASITGASDVNASATFTMLTVAAVIIGGGYFSGGIVTHIGTVFGAISLTMISVLLGLMRISTDYTATIQGFVLILILSLRLIKRGGHKVK